jgi:hypothetical protein
VTYRCGIAFGPIARDPDVTCDECGAVVSGIRANGMPAAWLRNGKAPPGWKLVRDKDGVRSDYCARCKEIKP